MKRLAVIIFLLLVAGLNATVWAGEPTELLIEQALDAPATVDFTNVTLEDALKGISAAMGVRLDPDESALGQLPYGRLMPLASVQLQNMNWRGALGEFLAPLALKFQVGKEQIFILGTDQLLRQPRRLTPRELSALIALEQANVNDSDDHLLRQIRDVTRMDFGFVLNGVRQEKMDDDIAEDLLGKTPISAANALDAYCSVLSNKAKRLPIKEDKSWKFTWWVQSDSIRGKETLDIIIRPDRDLAAMKLDRHIDASYRNTPLKDIFIDLGRSAVMPVGFESGAIMMVDGNIRDNASLTLQNGSIRMALEALSGMTGLEYRTDGLKLYITAGENLKALANQRAATAVTTTSSNPTVAVLTLPVPGSDMESMVFIRQSDLKEQGLLDKYMRLRQTMLDDFYQLLRTLPDETP